jgi:hypothetical protein
MKTSQEQQRAELRRRILAEHTKKAHARIEAEVDRYTAAVESEEKRLLGITPDAPKQYVPPAWMIGVLAHARPHMEPVKQKKEAGTNDHHELVPDPEASRHRSGEGDGGRGEGDPDRPVAER